MRAQYLMVTLKVEEMSFVNVISELKKQTQLDFFYSFDEIKVDRKISLDVKNVIVVYFFQYILCNNFTW